MLWTIVVVLMVLWVAGLVANIGGGLVHIFLFVAVCVIAFNFFNRRRRKL